MDDSVPRGFLMVAMEPPAALEEEFNDWYDLEHVPERRVVPGFETCNRFVCVHGWPRYLAFYDLRDADVIREPGYSAISGASFSPWSKRILARVRGLWRAHGEQIYPGHMLLARSPLRLLLIRFRQVPVDQEAELVACTQRIFEPESRVRIVRNAANEGDEYAVLSEWTEPLKASAVDLSTYGALAAHVDLCNTYVPYWPREGIPGVF
jgi:hypothetical protein